MKIVQYRFEDLNETVQIRKCVDAQNEEFLMVRFSGERWVVAEAYPQFDFWQIWHEFSEE